MIRMSASQISRLVASKTASRSLSLSAARLMAPEPPENKLDELFPRVEDFPSHHIGPRRHEAKLMLGELGYNVSVTGGGS